MHNKCISVKKTEGMGYYQYDGWMEWGNGNTIFILYMRNCKWLSCCEFLKLCVHKMGSSLCNWKSIRNVSYELYFFTVLLFQLFLFATYGKKMSECLTRDIFYRLAHILQYRENWLIFVCHFNNMIMTQVFFDGVYCNE